MRMYHKTKLFWQHNRIGVKVKMIDKKLNMARRVTWHSPAHQKVYLSHLSSDQSKCFPSSLFSVLTSLWSEWDESGAVCFSEINLELWGCLRGKPFHVMPHLHFSSQPVDFNYSVSQDSQKFKWSQFSFFFCHHQPADLNVIQQHRVALGDKNRTQCIQGFVRISRCIFYRFCDENEDPCSHRGMMWLNIWMKNDFNVIHFSQGVSQLVKLACELFMLVEEETRPLLWIFHE